MKIESPLWMTHEDIEREYGVPAWKTKKWVWSGKLAAYKVDGPKGRTWIRRDDFLALMEQARQSG